MVLARYARNERLGDAVQQWAFRLAERFAGARAYYDTLRARNIGHQAALRQLANRLVGILHGCLKTGTLYDEPPPGPTTTRPQLDNQKPGMSVALVESAGRDSGRMISWRSTSASAGLQRLMPAQFWINRPDLETPNELTRTVSVDSGRFRYECASRANLGARFRAPPQIWIRRPTSPAKLGVRDRVQAVIAAYKTGLATPGS